MAKGKKLTIGQFQAIKNALNVGVNKPLQRKLLAEAFDVSVKTVERIKQTPSWYFYQKRLTGPAAQEEARKMINDNKSINGTTESVTNPGPTIADEMRASVVDKTDAIKRIEAKVDNIHTVVNKILEHLNYKDQNWLDDEPDFILTGGDKPEIKNRPPQPSIIDRIRNRLNR